MLNCWQLFRFLILFFLVLHPALLYSQMSLQPFVSNVFKVTEITNCGDNRIFMAEQAGRIRIADLQGNLNTVPFLSITGRVYDGGGEQGLLGLAFSPHYASDRRFYVNYINNQGNTVISRFMATTANPDIADSLNEEILFTVTQPYSNHNGGAMHFGPDGYLYISLGDGGSGGDPHDNGQSLTTKLGKLLRIDVNTVSGYTIPPSNPFTDIAGTDPTIWAYGLRNAWRFSFDKITGDNWIADVGQNLWEEINFQPAASGGGENYGWRCYEGPVSYNLTGCQPQTAYVDPVHWYNHAGNCSVTGGYVYRGAKYASWFGKYFFTDYCSGVIQSLAPNDTGGYDLTTYGSFGGFVFTTFGQDRYGELYIGKGSSGVFKLADSSCTPVAYISQPDTLIAGTSYYVLSTLYSPELNYQWYLNDVPLPFGNSNQFVATVSGNYKVLVYNDSLCSSVSKTIFLALTMPDEFVIYPNPADDFADINWSLNFPGKKTIEVYDAAGRLCERTKLPNKANNYRINTTRYRKGIYIVQLIHQDAAFQEKLMVE